ncbi:MAG: hypothetical protein RBT78_02360 [Kiritimatiellia bacterium]|jgi:hypothetical protein|nr:hypothetical protein [Kiritimatiellia bacterium]OQA64929.1 MAG: hypothetical protein BWY39_00002 [Spirochaetes bacterium ADurb.Bin269]
MDQNKSLVMAPNDPDPEWPGGYAVTLRDAGAEEKTFLSEAAAHPGAGNRKVQQARVSRERYCEKFRWFAPKPRKAVSARQHEQKPSVRMPIRAGIQNITARYTNPDERVKRKNVECRTPNIERRTLTLSASQPPAGAAKNEWVTFPRESPRIDVSFCRRNPVVVHHSKRHIKPR